MAIKIYDTGAGAAKPRSVNTLTVTDKDVFAIINEHTNGVKIHLDGQRVIEVTATRQEPETVGAARAAFPEWDLQRDYDSGDIEIFRDGKWIVNTTPLQLNEVVAPAGISGASDVTDAVKNDSAVMPPRQGAALTGNAVLNPGVPAQQPAIVVPNQAISVTQGGNPVAQQVR